jgi:hypothetical protein
VVIIVANGIRNVAGPDVFQLDDLGRVTLAAHHDGRTAVTDDQAGVFAAAASDVLTAGPEVRLAPTHYQDWLQMADDSGGRCLLPGQPRLPTSAVARMP